MRRRYDLMVGSLTILSLGLWPDRHRNLPLEWPLPAKDWLQHYLEPGQAVGESPGSKDPEAILRRPISVVLLSNSLPTGRVLLEVRKVCEYTDDSFQNDAEVGYDL
jgi:hypothetical protein